MKRLLLLIPLAFLSCDSTGGFDSGAFNSGVSAVSGAYRDYDHIQHPDRYPVVQPVQPVYNPYYHP